MAKLTSIAMLLTLVGCAADPPPTTELQALLAIKNELGFIGLLLLILLIFK